MSYIDEFKLKGNSGYLADVDSQNRLRIVLPGNEVDGGNSTDALLGAAEVFTGTPADILNFTTIFVSVYSDVDSAVDGLELQQSCDGTNWDVIDKFTNLAGDPRTKNLFDVQAGCKYFRVVYTNGDIAQTVFRLFTVLKN